MTTKVEVIYTPDPSTTVERPVFLARVPGGFPSPADDYLEGKLDLNQYLAVPRQASRRHVLCARDRRLHDRGCLVPYCHQRGFCLIASD